MPKFKVDFVSDEIEGKIHSREVELPLDRSDFTTAHLDLEEEMFEKYGEKNISIITIIASEDISQPPLNSNASSIKKGDVVWCNWDESDHLGNGLKKEAVESLMRNYKPLWEAGPGYSFLVQLFSDDPLLR